MSDTPKYKTKCYNEKCEMHDENESGCKKNSKHAVDLCHNFHAESEKDYIRGSRNAYRFMMLHCLRELDVETDAEKLEKKVAQLVSEREEAISMLRNICRDCGDNDWGDDLHLADIIDKHLGRHLDR